MAKRSNGPAEHTLLDPVLGLFPDKRYRHYLEVPLAKRRIDVLCMPHSQYALWCAVELKVRDWRRALWQAITNFQVAERSYIALWYKNIPNTDEFNSLLEHYGVGLIEVWPTSATIVRRSSERRTRNSRRHFRAKMLRDQPL